MPAQLSVDQKAVVDQGLVTGRKPDDIPAYNAKMIEGFAEARHAWVTAE
jgi:protease I